MSTRSLIAKQIGENKYRTIYCHSDGYLTHNGALLVDHYNTEEMVDKLMALGSLSLLAEKADPDPSKVHGFDYDKRQKGVTVAYGRDRGEKDIQARDLTLEELDSPDSWAIYIYVFNLDKKWQYCTSGESHIGFLDVAEELQEVYGQYGMERPKGYYGYLTSEVAKYFKSREEQGGTTAEETSGISVSM